MLLLTGEVCTVMARNAAKTKIKAEVRMISSWLGKASLAAFLLNMGQTRNK